MDVACGWGRMGYEACAMLQMSADGPGYTFMKLFFWLFSFLVAASLPTESSLDGETAGIKLPSTLGYFFRDLNASTADHALHPQSQWLGDTKLAHYRLLPGRFPRGMGYHFDGLATVMSLRFDERRLRVMIQPFHSELFDAYESCIFFGSGTGPTAGVLPCLTNPLVNLLPIESQLWLTIDTVMWGRVDPATL
eukprot:SAG11_NODE_11701_length_743_cov_1.128882_2_plen_192_part_01